MRAVHWSWNLWLLLHVDWLDDLFLQYAPYKPGAKRSLAQQAKELGLEKPAMDLLQGKPVVISKYINPSKKGLEKETDVEKGIIHIVASVIATNTDVLTYLRKM